MLKYLRFFGTHLLIAAATLGLLAGSSWCWLGLAAGFLIWVGGDALSGPISTQPSRYRHPAVLDAALYSLFPPLVLMSFAFAWSLSTRDIFGFGAWVESLTGISVIASRSEATLTDTIGACLSFGLAMAMGGILTAHELAHRTNDRVAMWVARWMLAMAFNASLEVAHVFGHHRDVGTPADPATARRGETIYRFFVRSTIGQFFQAWRIERARLKAKGRDVLSWRNKVVAGALRSGVVSLLYFIAGGGTALGGFLAASIWNKFLLESLNYLEHYGLVRVPGTDIEARHAWDSTSRFSHAALFDLPWHADHHTHTGKKYPALRPSPESPLLPFGYLAALPVVWIPPLWRRSVRARLAEWDRRCASPSERELLTVSG